ncbi:uncharacterized protein METZ01_LOCUS14722 [marine metagenome]|uniref:Uncharacterized protein n=1 Tax=marine metagenome TaxID=408172 RepID=A0A381P6M5_9ZZZZ
MAGCHHIFPAHSSTSAFRNYVVDSKMICREMTLAILTMKTVTQENVAASKIDRAFLLMITRHHYHAWHW